jgi:hypothetical protein
MYLSIGVHHPKPGKEERLLESMKKFGEAQRGHKGLIFVFAWKDEESGSLIGTALWDSKEDWLAARPAMVKALEGVDFSELDYSSEAYRGSPVLWT